MTWSDFYLLCFFVGFLFSVLSFLGGATHIHLPARFHWPFHGGHHVGGMAGRGTMHARGGLSWFNAMTIITFLAWFGGVCFFLFTHLRVWVVVALRIPGPSWLTGACFFFEFIAPVVEGKHSHI